MIESDDEREERPSKSRKKREMHDAQALGKRLTALDAQRLERLPLGEGLLEAIVFAQKVKSREGLRRQLQYIGRLMRSADVEAIAAAIDDLTGESRAAIARMHRCERLREELLADDEALDRFVGEHPGLDRQWLHAKVRATRQEREQERPPRHARELYRFLQDTLDGSAGETDGGP